MRNVFLTGFMGSGKSRIARYISKRYGIACLETDNLIESRAQCTIREIFEQHGEPYFRELERQVLHDIPDYAVVSTGGGLPCHFDNMEWMRAQGTVFYLKARTEVLAARLDTPESRAKRPLLPDTAQLIPYIEATLKIREPFYLQADYTIDVSDLSVRDIVKQIIDTISR